MHTEFSSGNSGGALDKREMNDFERRLAAWQPRSEGLDTEAMLFAAGRASALLAASAQRRVRLSLAAAGLFAILAVGLGAWGLHERSERQSLARLIERRAAPPSKASHSAPAAPAVTAIEASRPSYEPSPGDYFTLRQSFLHDPSRWLASAEPNGPIDSWPPHAGPPPQLGPPPLTPRRLDMLLDD